MKKSLLYLFIFSVLMNVFTYMYFAKKSKFEDSRIENLQKNALSRKDSLEHLNAKLADADYFSLANDEKAQDYLIERVKVSNIDQMMSAAKDSILSLNASPKGNILVQYDPVNGTNFLINKVRFLNHRWIICDFSDGSLWGEVLMKYFVNPNGSFSFEVAETVIYPN